MKSLEAFSDTTKNMREEISELRRDKEATQKEHEKLQSLINHVQEDHAKQFQKMDEIVYILSKLEIAKQKELNEKGIPG